MSEWRDVQERLAQLQHRTGLVPRLAQPLAWTALSACKQASKGER